MALPPKICPECGEEYVHSAESCFHCDVPLVLEGELSDAPAEELASSSELVPVRVASAGWALALSGRLVEAGIAHRVEEASGDPPRSPGRAQPYAVLVRPEDAERARAIDAEQMQREIPDLPEGWDAAAADAEGCPACGAALEADAAECPDCGLALVGPE